MKRLKGILSVLAIFFCGLIVGGIIAGSVVLQDVVNKTIRGGPVNVRRVLVQRAKQDLHLDEDQAHQFWQILTETGEDLQRVTKPVHPEIDAALDKSAARLRNVLRPSQQPQFDSFLKDAHARWRSILIAGAVSGSTDPAKSAQ